MTSTRWIAECDDPAVVVVNDADDMRENYADALADGVLPDGMTFEEYLTGWQSMQVPDGLTHEAEQALARGHLDDPHQ